MTVRIVEETSLCQPASTKKKRAFITSPCLDSRDVVQNNGENVSFSRQGFFSAVASGLEGRCLLDKYSLVQPCRHRDRSP